MKLSHDSVERVAALAGLDLTSEETEELARVLTRILDYVERISEVPVDGIEPRANPWIDAAPFRDDEPRPWPDAPRLVDGASDREGPWIRVPLVVDKG